MKSRIESARQGGAAVASFVREHPLSAFLSLASAGLYFFSPPPAPVSGVGANLILFTKGLGLGSFVLNMLIAMFREHPFARSAIEGIERMLITSLFIYFLSVHCVEINADHFVASNALAFYAGYCVVFWGFIQLGSTALFSSPDPTPSFTVASKGQAVLASSDTKPVHQDDLRTTCVHEVGHLLVYKAAKNIPDALHVSVKTHLSSRDTIAGEVRRGDTPRRLSKPFLTWSMLLNLAGSVAEEAVLGAASAGSKSDYINWLLCAKLYLENGFGSVFYPDADTDEEMNNNRVVINALHQHHRDLLHELMAMNKDWIIQTADLLMAEHRFDAKRAKELLALADLPVGMACVEVQEERS